MDRSLAKNAVLNVIYKVLNVIFPLITAAYTARVLLPEGVGKVSYAQTIASYFTVIAALGIPTYGVKVISILRNQSDKNQINKNFTELWLILVCSTVICCITYIGLIFGVDTFRLDYKLYLAAGLQIALVSCNVDWFYQGNEKYAYITIRSIIVKICSLVAVIVFVKNLDDYIIYALINSLAVAGNYILNIINLRKYVSISFADINIKKHLKPVLILLLSTIAIDFYSKIDVTMLGFMSDDAHIAYYSNAVKIINVALMGITAITSVFLPRLSLYYKENKPKFDTLVNSGLQIIIGIALPCVIGLMIVSDDFVKVMFGQEFIKASLTLKILAPLLLIKGAGDLLCYQVIISAGREKYFLLTNGSAAVVNIILNSLLIPVFVQNGAAFASLISELVVNVGMLFVTVKVVNLEFEKRVYIPELTSSLVMGIIVWGISRIEMNYFVRLFICTFIGCITYALLNIILKNSLIKKIIEKIRNGKEDYR